MTPAMRTLALKAYRLTQKNITGIELGKRLGLEAGIAAEHAVRGYLIAQAEALRLTANEALVMRTLARLEARHVALASGPHVTTPRVDRAAGRRSGWCRTTIMRRLRTGTEADDLLRNHFLGLVEYRQSGRIWLTNVGWAFVWEAGLIKPNWKVPK